LSGIEFVLERYLVDLYQLNSESAFLPEGLGAEQQQTSSTKFLQWLYQIVYASFIVLSCDHNYRIYTCCI